MLFHGPTRYPRRRRGRKAAVCNDPAHFAPCAIRDGNVRPGDAVAAFGLGAIGLVAVQLTGCAGATAVIALDPLPARLQPPRPGPPAGHGSGFRIHVVRSSNAAGSGPKRS